MVSQKTFALAEAQDLYDILILGLEDYIKDKKNYNNT